MRRVDFGRSRLAPPLRAILGAVFDAFTRAEEDIYLTGQWVRYLLDPSEDTPQRPEFITSASPKAIEGIIAEALPFLTHVTAYRGGCHARLPADEGGEGPDTVVITTFRTSLPDYPFFRGSSFSPIERDLATREVTIQAIAIDKDGAVIDPFGGVAALEGRYIETILPDNQVFRRSAVWLFKVAKYAATYGAKPKEGLVRQGRTMASNVLDLGRREWREGLERILVGPRADLGFIYLAKTKVLGFVLPEVAVLQGFHESSPLHHKDVWDHTLKVVINAVPSLPIRWTALLHDIGKAWTRSITADGKVHFFRHEDMSRVLFEGIAVRLELDAALVERVGYLIEHHSRINLYTDDWTESAVRRLIKETGPYLDDLLKFSRADITSKRERRVEQVRRLLTELEERVHEVKTKDAELPLLPSGLGNLIMEHLGIPPSPEIGRIRAWLEAEVRAEKIEPRLAPEEYMTYIESEYGKPKKDPDSCQ